MNSLHKVLFAAVLLLMTTQGALAQSLYQSDAQSGKAVVKGTSSLHDWEMNVTEFSAWANADIKAGELFAVTQGSAVFKAAKILSDNSLMDKKAAEALKAKLFPDITFKVIAASPLQVSGQKASGVLKGELTLAGVKKAVDVPVNVVMLGDAKWTLSATIKIKMSDYKMEPPTAMMGTIKTGDAVELVFNMGFIKK